MKILAYSPTTSWQIDGETMETVTDFIFLGSKITANGDCSHEIKRHLLLGSRAMTNLDSILKSRDITLPTKVQIVKAMVFPVVMFRCESWTIKKAERWRIDAFELWCWRRLLKVPWTARRSNQSILKEVNPEYSLEDWRSSWSSNTLATWGEEPIHWKRLWCWGRLRARGEGATEDEMLGWPHKLREIVKDREACAAVRGAAKSRTRLSDLTTKTWFYQSPTLRHLGCFYLFHYYKHFYSELSWCTHWWAFWEQVFRNENTGKRYEHFSGSCHKLPYRMAASIYIHITRYKCSFHLTNIMDCHFYYGN